MTSRYNYAVVIGQNVHIEDTVNCVRIFVILMKSSPRENII